MEPHLGTQSHYVSICPYRPRDQTEVLLTVDQGSNRMLLLLLLLPVNISD